MDQIGAVVGPLIFAAVLFWKNNFRLGFGVLFIPSFLTILSLVFAKSQGRAPEDFEMPQHPPSQPAPEAKLAPAYWYYAAFSCLCVAGLVNFQIISYHWKVHALLLDAWIPLVYALTMAVDGAAALAVGKAYDRWGFKTLGLIPLVTLIVPFFVFLPSFAASAVVVAILWGIVMGMHETIMRAAIADLTHIQKRGFGYGFFNTIYGGAWFLGSFIVGALYGLNIRFVLFFVVVLELAAFAIFWMFLRRVPR
jgi:MFS family permease